MPRKSIDLQPSLEYLSVLAEDGSVDEELEPDLSDELLLRFHRTMLLSRRFDQRLLSLQRQGRIGTFAPVSGQEAAQIGAVAAIGDDDWLVPAFRETAASLWRGIGMEDLLVYNAGYNEGAGIPEGKHDLPIAIPVASQLPYAVGIAYAAQYRETGEVVMTFFGDGATSEGDFHEAMNFAGVFGTPTVFVCQNNHWAISVPREHQTKSETLAQKALAYGMPGLQVDGNDVLAVHLAATEAVERARDGGGPTMIECVTYRLSLHTTADDPSKYREQEEVERWKERDPIPRLQGYLIDRELLGEDDVEEIEGDIEGEIDDAWAAAEETMEEIGDPAAMFDYVYAERPPYLEEQRQAFQKRQDTDAEADDDG